MHHLHDICNPMTHSSLEELLARLELGDGARMIDIACGHGELLVKAAERAEIEGVGVDLSPWALHRACRRARSRQLRGSIEWWLGDGGSLPPDPRWDVTACLGASWIWHGFKGTLSALAKRTVPGGRVVVGDLRLQEGVSAERRNDVIGAGTAMTTLADQMAAMQDLGLEPLHCHISSDEAWAGYHRLVIESADTYDGPEPAEDPGALAREWQMEFKRDRTILEWTVWTARKPGQS